MSKPFDATLKDLGRGNASDFLLAFDQPPALPVSLLNVDLSTITTAGDLVIGLGKPLHEIVHIEFQASASATKHADVLGYHALLYRHYLVPVHSIVLLLRPQAGHPNTDGTIRYSSRPSRGKMDFGYEVVRLWERPADELLKAGLGTVPLAQLGQFPAGVSVAEGVSFTISQALDRILREAPADQARRLLTATYLLSGLRIGRQLAKHIFRGALAMRESDTYLAILDEGREEEAKRIIFLVGEDRLGAIDPALRIRINAISDIEQLEVLATRLHKVSSWQELLPG